MNRNKEQAQEYLSPALQYISEWLEIQNFLNQQNPGYSVAISYKGQVIYSRGLGYANIENNEVMTPNHLFRVASQSKSFTATAIMQLMEAGKLSIHDSASKYLPFLQENSDRRVGEITLQEMLQHTSGICRDGVNSLFWNLQRDFPDKEEMIAYLKKEPLIIDSSTRFKYSNYAYGLLGYIIEEVSGKTYADYLRDEIFEPLGLFKIGVDYTPNSSAYATGYTALSLSGNQVPISAQILTKALVSAGGISSNAESLCLFYDAVMPGSGKLLSDKSKREMLRQHWELVDGPGKRGYGLGFKSEYFGDRRLGGHGGGIPGALTCTLFDTNDRIVVSVLSNSNAGKVWDIQRGIWHILDKYKAEYDTSSPLLKYQGRFYDIWGAYHYVAMGDKVYMTLPSAVHPFTDCSELQHVKENIFKISKESGYGSFGQNVVFNMDEETVKSVDHAGLYRMNLEEYESYMEGLRQKYLNART